MVAASALPLTREVTVPLQRQDGIELNGTLLSPWTLRPHPPPLLQVKLAHCTPLFVCHVLPVSCQAYTLPRISYSYTHIFAHNLSDYWLFKTRFCLISVFLDD